MNAHGCKYNNDTNQVRNSPRIWINTDDDMEEKEPSENEMDIHKEVAYMALHHRSKKICEVESEQRAIKES